MTKMFEVTDFFDYCINEKCLENNNYESTIKLLYEYGYRTIAINQTIDGNDLDQKKKKKKGEPREPQLDPVPEPYVPSIIPGCENLKIFNRLTIVFAGQEVLHKITKSPNYKKYHIVGVLPTTLQATLFVCSSFDADIFCFNPENKNHVKRNRKMYKQLVDRGYHFELPYGPAIEDTTKRKNIIHTAHLYHTFIKSKNIILSSSATSPIFIRNPYDIVNLGLIFGLNEQQAKNAISHNGRQVYLNAVGRRHGKSVVFVTNTEQKEQGESEIIELDDTRNISESVICITESDEDMETDQPAPKKVKQ
ncbi:ribonuclease P protein subunit p30 [Zophobas morio]|uniref:ribonuclease P protein subunit p30 n=1 Tax=Zophobas morio TaxID=2755281 RepID=UPI0030827832